MWDIKACRVCFTTAGKLFNLNVDALRIHFNTISGLQTVQGNGMPEYLCLECAAYVKKFNMFRNKCHRAHYALQQILNKQKEIKLPHLKTINRKQLKILPSLSYLPVVQFSTITKEDTLTRNKNNINLNDDDSQIKIEYDNGNEFGENLPSNMLQAVVEDTEDVTPNILRSRLEGNVEHPPHNEISLELPVSSKVENVMDDLFSTDNQGITTDCEAESLEEMSYDIDDKGVIPIDHEEYGTMVSLSTKEAKAVQEVLKYTSVGEFQCDCGMRFKKKSVCEQHKRKHDIHVNGPNYCEICNSYYKTEFQLQYHMKEHHMFKYLCKLCPEVSFIRTEAKKHYVRKHIQQGNKLGDQIWDVIPKPSWYGKRGGARTKGLFANKRIKKFKNVPEDFPLYSPISQDEQYKMVEQRKESRNYLEAKFKCELCYRGFRLTSTYNKHMVKHDPTKSGNAQCDMCKLYFQDTRKIYKHMFNNHLFKYCCKYCDFVCTNKGQALYHYKWHNNVTYDCPHCDKTFAKISTQLTHIRFKHPSTALCNICGHSFVSSNGLHCHKRVSHTKEEIEQSYAVSASNDPTAEFYCGDCAMQFCNEQAYVTHLGSSRKHVDTNISVVRTEMANRRLERLVSARAGRGDWVPPGPDPSQPHKRRRAPPRAEILNIGTSTATVCAVCGEYLMTDVMARKHYMAAHPGTDYLKRYMCDVCGHTTVQYANLLAHMRVHTREKPYQCPHCERRFSMPSNRDRHLVVHTGEKRYQCQHCSRRFTQSTAVKLHIQTVHLKIPYKPWDKKNRKRRKDAEPNTAGLNVVLPPAIAPAPPQAKIILEPQPKILLEPQEYITYISYTNEQ